MFTAPLHQAPPEKLSQLPSFADYLLEHKLDELSSLQIALGRQLNLPLLKQLEHLSEDELYQLVRQTNAELLKALAANKLNELIEELNNRWLSDKMPANKYSVVAEDISLIAYIRKTAFLHFILEYCNDAEKMLQLIREIDHYVIQMELAATKTYIGILRENINQSALFIKKVSETIPGAVYTFDLKKFRPLYTNKKAIEVTGYTQEEISDVDNVLDHLIHHEDRQYVQKQIEGIRDAQDHEIVSYKYRLKTKNGQFKWVRNFESVFKRDENGIPVESIGITLDIDKNHKAAMDLKENELLYRRAEAITHIGSFVWDVSTGDVKWSDELYRIHGMEPGSEKMTYERVSTFTHPEDKPEIERVYEEAFAEKKPLDFYYRITTPKGEEKILHARGEIVLDENEEVSTVIGTIQDVTEKQTLIRKLKHSESIHRQAEELANMGSWTWNLVTNETEWSEQMYKIYEMDEPVTKDIFQEFVHPEDREKAAAILEKVLKEHYSDHTIRIITRTGKVKKLHTVARLHTDKNGNPAYIVGAEQDITEKENLLETLKKKEQVYKQAEELALMGNWSWDVEADKLEWTDQLYRIYGLQPQSEPMTIARFLSFVHPDDWEEVSRRVVEITQKDLLDHTFRIITADGKTRIVRSVAQVQRNKKGEPVYVVGSERDITEKQTLIDRLKHSESLYKQAQMLTHVGNWSWDIRNNKIEWSDELFRIYGLEPQSKRLDYQTYLELIHPDDRERVKAQVSHAYETGLSWENTHKLIRPSGETRIVFARGEVLKDDKGEAYMMIGTAQDVTERQTLIDRLQESEKLSRQAESLAHLGSWTMDLKTKEFIWSEEMFRIYEVKLDTKPTFDTWLSFIVPEEREAVLAYYEECLREKKLYDKVHRVILPNGKIKTVHRKGEFILDEYGEPIRMIGTTQDVTEEYRIQQELKENQTFIRKITDATPSIIASYNVNTGEYVFISEGIEKLLGYTVEEVMGEGFEFFLSIVHPEDLPEVTEKNKSSLEEANADPSRNDMVVEFIYRMRHKTGEYRWFHTYGTIFDRNAEGKVEHVLNISLDITEQIKASQTIKEQEHFIQQIADASPTILYLYDVTKQSIVYINREIFFVLGYAPDEIMRMGDHLTENLYHPEDYHLLPARKESEKNFQQVDSMMQYECRMKNKAGEWRWLLVREIVFKTDEQGNISQILGAALDINKRKEMEKTILQNTMLLEQSNASLEEFAYVASHDLKEPLRKISTFGDRLAATQQDVLTPEGKMFLQKIVDASQRMQTMINDLLSISMITGNTAFEQFSLQKILEETLQTLEFKIEQLNARIEADPLPEAFIIPFQFRQLFQNLLSNSLKFVRPGVQPVVRINYSLIDGKEVTQYGISKADRYHKISVADNGIGFDNEYAAKIFAIFQRLHGRSEYEGSGIGLAICKKIVEHHGGVIYAEGVENEGATFTIILPAQ